MHETRHEFQKAFYNQYCTTNPNRNNISVFSPNFLIYFTQLYVVYTDPLWFGSKYEGKSQIAKLNELDEEDDATSSKCLMELIRQC